MNTPKELKAIADDFNVKAKAAQLEADRKEEARLLAAVEAHITECEKAIMAAARRGQYTCEVDVPRTAHSRVMGALAAYNPVVCHDGRDRQSVEFSWK